MYMVPFKLYISYLSIMKYSNTSLPYYITQVFFVHQYPHNDVEAFIQLVSLVVIWLLLGFINAPKELSKPQNVSEDYNFNLLAWRYTLML